METKSTLAKIIDGFLLISLFYVISLSFLSKVKTSIIIRSLVALFLSIILFVLFLKLNKRLSYNKMVKASEQKNLDNFASLIKFMTPKQTTQLLLGAFKKCCDTTIENKHIVVKNDGINYTVIHNFIEPEISLGFIFNSIESCKEKSNIIIMANTFSSNAIRFKQTATNLFFLDIYDSFLFLKNADCLPTKSEPTAKHRLGIKKTLKNAFKRTNATKFLKLSLYLVAFSILVPFSSYYKSLAIFFAFIALVCMFAKKESLNDHPLPPFLK